MTDEKNDPPPPEEDSPSNSSSTPATTTPSFFVYLLVSATCHKSYVGATVNLNRRLEAHNALRSGGAKRTTREVARHGGSWSRVCYVSRFPTWKTALQFEWRWKQLTRTTAATSSSSQNIQIICDTTSVPTCIRKRMQALQQLLSLERATTASLPFADWHPRVHIEADWTTSIHVIQSN